MNLETSSGSRPKKSNEDLLFDDIDFKPLTSGLGFHQPKTTTEVKPAFADKVVPPPIAKRQITPVAKDMNVYQNDLSLFYNKTEVKAPVVQEEQRSEPSLRPARAFPRLAAYIMDVGFLLSVLGLVMTIMARMARLDLMDMWVSFPHEMTPLALTLFSGFYLIYFAIFEKTQNSTLGKQLLGLRLVDQEGKAPSFLLLLFRSFMTLLNFASLGLFAYFDLQGKVSGTRVVESR
jgi:uncharacterized RDD family membrane protein YckC